MEHNEIVVSAATIDRSASILLYAAMLPGAWKCLPLSRLTALARRVAAAMLLAQALVLLFALDILPTTAFMRHNLNFHGEGGYLATLSATQLALVGATALLAAIFQRSGRIWQRRYLVGIGALFFFFALDEYMAIHEAIADWGLKYAALGVAVAALTLLLAAQSPKRERVWYGCLLAGLAIAAAGAVALESQWLPCGYEWRFFRIDGCFDFGAIEECLEFLGIWLALVGALGLMDETAATKTGAARRLLCLSPLLWLAFLFVYSLIPRLELHFSAQPALVQFESGPRLAGFRQDGADFQLYTQARQADYIGLGYSIHLVDRATGLSVAHRDTWTNRQHGYVLFGQDYAPIYRQRVDIEIPADAPRNRALVFALSAWRKGKRGQFEDLPIVASDRQQLSETQAILGELVLPAPQPPPAAAPIARFDGRFALLDAALPARAMPGDRLAIPITWRSDADASGDYTQFLHFVHAQTGAQWGYDQRPLGARLPTRLWYAGLQDSEVWRFTLPAELAPGQYDVLAGLYDASTLQRLPARDAAGQPLLHARAPLGSLRIESGRDEHAQKGRP